MHLPNLYVTSSLINCCVELLSIAQVQRNAAENQLAKIADHGEENLPAVGSIPRPPRLIEATIASIRYDIGLDGVEYNKEWQDLRVGRQSSYNNTS